MSSIETNDDGKLHFLQKYILFTEPAFIFLILPIFNGELINYSINSKLSEIGLDKISLILICYSPISLIILSIDSLNFCS